MKKIITLFAFVFCLYFNAVACDCARLESFCESVVNQFDGSPRVAAIVRVVVKNKTEETIDFKIIETIYGPALGEKTFTFLSNYDGFDTGQEFIVALHSPISEPQYFHWCLTEYLPIKNGKVSGYITEEISELSLSDFSKLDFCGLSQPTLAISPTLLSGNILTATPNTWFFPATVNIKLFNAMGQLIYSNKISEYKGDIPIEIELDNLLAGVYFCQISFWGRKETVKIVKVN